MSPFGRILFTGLADANRRIAAGVTAEAAAETMLTEVRAALAEPAAECANCGEPIDEAPVEAFETFDALLCDLCFEDRLAEAEEAEDRRRANPLEPGFRGDR